ncbi:hypothetical protein GCM10010266_07680 [Streptomyces griseomycini]|nr:hypothetical protein GCM10010266_07680 [Streptomyces griseomycini]
MHTVVHRRGEHGDEQGRYADERQQKRPELQGLQEAVVPPDRLRHGRPHRGVQEQVREDAPSRPAQYAPPSALGRPLRRRRTPATRTPKI